MDKKIIENANKIFADGSMTYFNAAQFFPEEIKNDVSILYSFVRVADDFVDCSPQKPDDFFAFKDLFLNKSLKNIKTGNSILDSFCELMSKKQIPQKAPSEFLKAMEQDLSKNTYQTFEELEAYMIGSAEVVGVMMAKIIGLEKNSEPFARKLGKAMQFINFIRDIDYDLKVLNRVYIPREVITKYDLENLEEETARTSSKKFTQLIRDLIQLYFEWQIEAEHGFKLIPHDLLIPIKTASDMYKWTANEIYADPFIIFRERLKPKRNQIIETAEKIASLIN